LKKKQGTSSGKILKVDREHPSREDLSKTIQILREGGLVAFPTDTFYGLGADARNPIAVERLYQVKGREEAKPILVVVSDRERAIALATNVSKEARQLMERFWPGPLSLLLSARSDFPPALLGGGSKIGVRVPNHPTALALLREWGGPMTATSANPAGGNSPVTAEEVAESLGPKVDLILDAGPLPGGQPSTIVDATLRPPRLVRPGRIPFSLVMEALGLTLTDEHEW
jgi:L-threonylcarbamoyladenylate synthase